jgi:hypothetical protein
MNRHTYRHTHRHIHRHIDRPPPSLIHTVERTSMGVVTAKRFSTSNIAVVCPLSPSPSRPTDSDFAIVDLVTKEAPEATSSDTTTSGEAGSWVKSPPTASEINISSSTDEVRDADDTAIRGRGTAASPSPMVAVS